MVWGWGRHAQFIADLCQKTAHLPSFATDYRLHCQKTCIKWSGGLLHGVSCTFDKGMSGLNFNSKGCLLNAKLDESLRVFGDFWYHIYLYLHIYFLKFEFSRVEIVLWCTLICLCHNSFHTAVLLFALFLPFCLRKMESNCFPVNFSPSVRGAVCPQSFRSKRSRPRAAVFLPPLL